MEEERNFKHQFYPRLFFLPAEITANQKNNECPLPAGPRFHRFRASGPSFGVTGLTRPAPRNSTGRRHEEWRDNHQILNELAPGPKGGAPAIGQRLETHAATTVNLA